MVRKEVIQNFITLTNYPLDKFLLESKNFFENDIRPIVNFYKGYVNFLDKQKIDKLNNLIDNSIFITDLFYQKKGNMKTVDYWELLDRIEEIKTKLQYTKKLPKYLRSSLIEGATKSGFVFDYTMGNQETLEQITKGVLEQENSNNSWVNQAVDNDLKEQDYDVSGGKNLKLRKALFQSNLVTSMIDYTIGERIYGLDIQKRFEFEGDDLKVLNYRDTVFQTADILSKLTRGSIPEFSSLGLDLDLYKGNNYSQLNYPSITRELRRNFATDDLFSEFRILEIKLEEGDITIEYEVNTKYELVILQNVSL